MARSYSNPKIIKLTPAKAKELDDLGDWEGQRPVDEKRVEEIAGWITGQEFHLGRVVIASLAYDNDRRCRIDGRKTCKAVQAAGKTVPSSYQEVRCDTPRDVAEAYAACGDPQVGHTRQQTVWSYYCLLSGQRVSLTQDQAYKISSAIARRNGNLHGLRLSIAEQAEALAEYPNEVAALHRLLFEDHQKSKHLRKVPVISAMFDSLVRLPEEGELFWQAVRDGDMLAVDDPALLLRSFLLAAISVGGQPYVRSGTVPVSQTQILAMCLEHWNAWRYGQKPKSLRACKEILWSEQYDAKMERRQRRASRREEQAEAAQPATAARRSRKKASKKAARRTRNG